MFRSAFCSTRRCGREDPHEIPAARPLLEPLELKGKVVTGDALHTQRDLARFLVEKKHADYFFTVKDNVCRVSFTVNDFGNTVRGNSQLIIGKPPGTVVMEQNAKAGSSSTVVENNSAELKQLQQELHQYKQQEMLYQQQIESLQYSLDSLEAICSNKNEENSKLALYAAEFHSMNERYGNLPYNIEKKISTYLSKEE